MAQKYIKGGVFRKVVYEKSGNGYHFRLNWAPLAQKIQQAQVMIDTMVATDMQKYMPYSEDGTLRAETAMLNTQSAGQGIVYKYPPLSDYGHYQYEGIVYVDPVYGVGAFHSPEYGFWSRAGVQKVPSTRTLHYTAPTAERHWDEVAIRNHSKEWEKAVLEVLTK